MLQSHSDGVRLVTDPVLTEAEVTENQAPGDTSKKDDEEVLVGEGIIKLSNIKIQYHKK